MAFIVGEIKMLELLMSLIIKTSEVDEHANVEWAGDIYLCEVALNEQE